MEIEDEIRNLMIEESNEKRGDMRKVKVRVGNKDKEVIKKVIIEVIIKSEEKKRMKEIGNMMVGSKFLE